MLDFEIDLSEFNTEEQDIINTHLRNYNDDYEYCGCYDETVIVHCKSETEYDDLDNLITKLRQR